MLLSTATCTQPTRELSNAQLGTPNRVLRRTWSGIKLHYYIASGRAASGQVTLLCRVSLHRVSLHRVASHRVMSLSLLGSHSIGSHHIRSHHIRSLSCVGSRSIGSHCIRSHCIGSRYIGFALRFSPCHFSFCLCVPKPFPLL